MELKGGPLALFWNGDQTLHFWIKLKENDGHKAVIKYSYTC